MYKELENVKFGLLLTMLGLGFGVVLGIAFGIFEDTFKDYVARGITAFPDLHDSKSQSKIWRYAQRAHFHATGIAAFSISLILLMMFSNLKMSLKPVAASLVGLGNLYPLSWITMFYLAPSMGRDAAHLHIAVQTVTYIAYGGLIAGIGMLFFNLFFGAFAQRKVSELVLVKLGLLMTLAGLIFGISMGIAFGVNEDGFKSAVAQGIAAVPDVHDNKSQSKIWRYAQRAHFHAAAIAAFSLGLIFLVMIANLRTSLKSITAILIGMGSIYPLAWFTMFWLAPWIGRDAAHDHILTEIFTFVGVGGLSLGMLILSANLFLGWFPEYYEGKYMDDFQPKTPDKTEHVRVKTKPAEADPNKKSPHPQEAKHKTLLDKISHKISGG